MLAGGQSKQTVELRLHHVRRFAAECRIHPGEVCLEDLSDWLSSHDWSPNTRRAYRGSLCSFYRWATRTGRLMRDPAAELPPVRVCPGAPRPAPDEVILHALDRADDRERLMVMLAAMVGLRRGEIARVHRDDALLYPDGWRLRVHGKGGKVRVVPLPAVLGDALRRLPPGYAFPGWDEKPMTPAHVGKVVSRVLGPGWTTHTLRHRFASAAYLGERDIMAVRDLLGHSNVRTTQIYTAVPDGSLRAAVMAAALPVQQA
jgi:integrase